MKKMTGTTYLFIAFLLIAITVVCLSLVIRTKYELTPACQRAGVLPLIVGSVMATLCVIGLFNELRKKPTTEQSPARTERRVFTAVTIGPQLHAGRVQMLTTAWIIGYIVLVYFIGFTLSTFLWAGAYLKWKNHGWIRSIVFGLGFATFVYIVFDFLLDVGLYQGVLYIPLYRFLP